MKALVLAAGRGTRLGDGFSDTCKALIQIQGRPLLAYIIDSLLDCGISRIIITTGYMAHQIKKFVAENYPEAPIVLVYSDRFLETNYIYSMWLARNYLLDDDVLYIHGDTVFDTAVMRSLIGDPAKSAAVVHEALVSEKDFNARIFNGKISEINVRLNGEDCNAVCPIYKFGEEDFGLWMRKIDEYINKGWQQCYAELAFNEISDQISLSPHYVSCSLCMEVDDPNDLALAEQAMATLEQQKP